MANLPETEDFAEGTYQIETSDRVLGGPGGIANKQAEQLGNRTAWLRAAIRKIIDGTTAIGKATQLATARTLRFKGAVNGSGSFDGSADTEITLTLADSGIAPGSYTKITLNAKGLATAGSSPTTLSGLGISDAFTKTETAAAVQQAVANLVASSPAALDTLKELADALGNDPNFAATMTNALAAKASKADTYTKSEVDIRVVSRAIRDAVTTIGLAGDNPDFPYMRRESDGGVYYLQPRLGFTPIQQGTGRGQGTNTVKIGWSNDQSPRLKVTVDNTDLGHFWTSSSFNPGDYIKKGQVLNPGESPKSMSAATGSIGGISGDASAFEARGNASGAALISFHRPGIFGAHLGIDTDNQLKVGGWSMGAVAHTILHSGNCDMTGAIVHFPFSEPPAGFLRANGTAVSRSSYPALFARIGTTYGAGDGSTTFNLPDWRGVFVRGLDEGRSLDPGRALNSFQYDQLQGHAQSAPPGASGFTVYASGQGGASAGGGINTAPRTGGVVSDGVNGNPRVGAETRPVNIAFLA